MKLLLTRNDGSPIIIESDAVKLVEKDSEGKAHLVFGADMGRTVLEPFEAVMNAMGASKVYGAVVVSGMPRPK